MNMRSKLLLVLLAALLLYYFVYVENAFNTISFEEGLNELESIDSKFFSEGLVPAQEQKLKEYNLELTDFEKKLNEKKQDKEANALKLLVKARKELILMQLNLIEARKAIECKKQMEAVDSIISSAESARNSIQEYLEYDKLAEKTKEWNENVLDTTNSIIISFREIKDKRSC